MQKFKLNSKVYNIPSSWNDVSISQFIQLSNASKEEGDYKFIEELSILTQIPKSEILKATTRHINRLSEKIKWAQQLPKDQSPLYEFEFEGEKYSGVKSGFRARFEQFIDASHFQREMPGIEFWPYILTIYYTPYNKDNFTEYLEKMKRVSVTIGIRASAFFLTLQKISKNGMGTFLKETEQLLQTCLQVKSISETNTDGSELPTNSQIMTSLKSIKSMRKKLEKSSPT